MHFGESTASQRSEVRNTHLGFWRRAISHPAPWAVIAFTPAYAAAARLAAACIPALLGGVPLVGAVCVGGAPAGNALVTLELTGVEDIFVMVLDCGAGPLNLPGWLRKIFIFPHWGLAFFSRGSYKGSSYFEGFGH